MSIRKYTILTSSETSTIDFSQVLETSLNTLRYNKDRTKTFVKYEGPQPSFLSGKTEYTHSEISTILNDVDGDWYIAPTE